MRIPTSFLLVPAVMAAVPASAQLVVENSAPVVYYPQFFAALLSGILLAFGFQLLLTTLSLALGLSATPNLKKAAAHQKVAALTAGDAHFADEYHAPEDAPASGMITTGLGLWAMITSSVALFCASWCATHLSVSPHDNTGIILGLVIWAAFFMIMTYFEIKSVTTLIGGLVNTAFSGIRASFSGIAGLMTPAPEAQVERMARQTARGMYEEVSSLIGKSDIGSRLEEYLSRLKPAQPNYDRIAGELAELIGQIELEERTQVGDHEVSRIIDLHLGQKGAKGFSTHNVGKIKDAAQQAVHAVRRRREGSVADKAMAAVGALTPISEQDAKAYRDKVAQFLSSTGRDELSPDNLTADLQRIFDDPKAGMDVIKQRLGLFDRDTLKALVSHQPGLDEGKAESIIGMAEKAFAAIKEKYGSAQQTGGDKLATAKEGTQSLSNTAQHALEEGKAKLSGLPAAAAARIEAYFNGLDRPELNYGELKSDIQQIFDDPSHAPSVLKDRLGKLDRQSVVALLSSNSHISEDQAEAVVEKVLGARDAVSDKVDQVTTEVGRRVETMRRKAVLTAEHARKNAVAASWWVLGTAAVSALSAAAGGFVAGM